ncbi:hypothetical protein BJ964_005675 [Actinoplanes lobatus]|uniref:Uncharacterized protein n=1 Tax=Actinoplanes lobatus TaxID=113568 RepID=A0A7W7HJ70_9ACTN|nr:hypothetical protein [Actinoplanes lobatus]
MLERLAASSSQSDRLIGSVSLSNQFAARVM